MGDDDQQRISINEYGVKRVLAVGINDYGREDAALRGCVPDVADWRAYLLTDGVLERNITTILDRDATKATVLGEYRSLAKLTQPGDTLGFIFSGHGSQLPDQVGGDEKDGLDECLCMADCLTGPSFAAGCIRDDELAGIIGFVARGARVVVVIDACHSGTSTREFPGYRLANGPEGYRKARFLDNPEMPGIGAMPAKRGLLGRKHPGRVVMPSSVEVLLAGCASDQTSADAYLAGGYAGAFSHFLKQALRTRPGISIGQAHDATVSALYSAGFEQSAQLEASSGSIGKPLF